MNEDEKRAEAEVLATFESELPTECIPSVEQTPRLVAYLKRIFLAGLEAGRPKWVACSERLERTQGHLDDFMGKYGEQGIQIATLKLEIQSLQTQLRQAMSLARERGEQLKHLEAVGVPVHSLLLVSTDATVTKEIREYAEKLAAEMMERRRAGK